MNDIDHARLLLGMANSDLNALQGFLVRGGPEEGQYFSDEIYGFHAQQATEKCLKAWIASKGIRYPKSHDLMALPDVLADAGEPASAFDDLVDLNPFAVQFRYETIDVNDEPLDRVAWKQKVERLFAVVAEKVREASAT